MSVFALAPYLWHSYWRSVKHGGMWKNANMMSVTGMGFFALPGYLAMWGIAIASFHRGELGRGLALAESTLTIVMMGWLVLPLLVSSISGRGQGLELARLQQFPLSTMQLFQAGVLSSLMQPVYWILLLVSVVSILVLGFAPMAVPGVVAALLLLTGTAIFSWALGLAGTALVSSRGGKEFSLGFVAFGSAPFWILLAADYNYEDGVLTMEALDRLFTIYNENTGEGLLVTLQSWSPARLVSRVASGEDIWTGLLVLAAGLALSLGVAVWSLRRQIANPPSTGGGQGDRRRSLPGVPFLPPALGAATAKEVAYLARTLDALMGYVAGVVAVVWMLVRPEHAYWVMALVMPAVVMNQMVIPLNTFGLDGSAVDRYRLLPLTGQQVMLAKNFAYVILVVSEVGIAVVAGCFTTGPLYALACLVAALTVCFLTMAWGNFISIKSPAAREFFNFDSAEQAGGALPMIYSLVVWIPPVAAGAPLLGFGHGAVLLGELVLMGAAALLWWLLLPGAVRQFEASAADMRDKLEVSS
jgi:hypothetical protein